MAHFWFIWPTIKATNKAVTIATEHFGVSHHKNTPANAFRHAIWNYLIASKCSNYSKNDAKIVTWTKKITELHELILPGNELANVMDLHNNAVGLHVYTTNKQLPLEQVIILLLAMVQNSVKVTSTEEVINIPKDQLIHIIEITTP
jgi:hypothetical protein